ncbi:metalloregulator ArsR/SmtB family transcription factor [Lentzea sp. CC55]|uniref:metalloregulator ArsR/SmtB family transcription factor n=1 Tax=Lentzea sp. CC55 TaxID=2884909 RepID=UPI001F44778C|nr:metalloregulator ArsR/SmtB family transcription factor [Lentzea sp. CC55]MCG8922492.1 metalloregulator ArsR/SmtB family transcription factor [Lentzea sp. CC55]
MVAPEFLRMASHPLRWRLLTELAAGDHRVRELTERVGEPQNLVSYHLRLLRDGGLVRSRRSSSDGRDTYYHLDLDRCASSFAATAAALHPALETTPVATPLDDVRVLFACTGNSARSPIAEALLRRHGADASSAGSEPRARVHPHAVKVLREEFGLDLDQAPRPFPTDRYDYVITLCDRVREVCPEFEGRHARIHWSIAGPVGYPEFVRTARELDTRIRHLLPVLAAAARQKG